MHTPLPEAPEHRLTVLVRDPTTLFVYWEVIGDGEAVARDLLGAEEDADATWMLRLTTLETGAREAIPVRLDARNWYLHVEPGRSYGVELGLADAGGAFHPLRRHAPVAMPALSYSHLYDKQWMILEEDYVRLLSFGGLEFLGSSAGMPRPPEEPAETWLTVVQELPGVTGGATSPGVPDYQGRH